MYLLIQIFEQRRVKEILDGDLQTIAYLFDGVDLSVQVSARHNVAQGRLGDTTNIGQAVDRDQSLSAEFQYTQTDGFTNYHSVSPNLIELTPFYIEHVKRVN